MRRFSIIKSLQLILWLAVGATAVCGATVWDAKQLNDGGSVTLTSVPVTAVFDDAFYVQSDAGACGIRVERAGHGVLQGMLVDLSGKIYTNPDLERYIAATSVDDTGSSCVVSPVAMGCSAVVGGHLDYEAATGRGQAGIANAAGLNTVGLLVKLSGTVGFVDAGSFVIDDGGTPVKCLMPPGIVADPRWSFASVSGISACGWTGGQMERVLRVRSTDDISVVVPDQLVQKVQTAGSFADDLSAGGLSGVWAYSGAVMGEPSTFGKTDVAGLFSDGGYSHLTYRFDVPAGNTSFVKLSFTATVYSGGYDPGESPLALTYSYDGEYWFTSATLSSPGPSWTQLSGSAVVAPLDRTLYVRLGGQTVAGGTAWYATIDKMEVSFTAANVKNVKSAPYNAKGDGVTNDRTAIQSAINAASSGGGIVYFPPGNYFVSGSQISLRANVGLAGLGSQSVIIQGDTMANMISAKGSVSTPCENPSIRFLTFKMQGGASNVCWSFANFDHCRNAFVSNCSFDSLSQAGPFGMFHQVDFTLCDGVVVTHNVFKNCLAGTGMNGAAWEPTLATNGYFARNLVSMYFDTGIGLWTGAQNTRICHNVFRGPVDADPNAVGVDNDGAHDCLVDHNTFIGGQIGVRVMDSHNGNYPINRFTVDGNTFRGQKDNPNGNPACAIKLVHTISAEYPNYEMDTIIKNNRIEIVSTGIMSWSYVTRDTGPDLTLTIEDNSFTGNGKAVIIGGYGHNGNYVIPNRTNTFNMNDGALVGSPRTSEWANPDGDPLVVFGNENVLATPVPSPHTYSSTATIWSGNLVPGFYGVKLRYGTLQPNPATYALMNILGLSTQIVAAQSNSSFDLYFAISGSGVRTIQFSLPSGGFNATIDSLVLYRML